jgi:hypothetical protein
MPAGWGAMCSWRRKVTGSGHWPATHAPSECSSSGWWSMVERVQLPFGMFAAVVGDVDRAAAGARPQGVTRACICICTSWSAVLARSLHSVFRLVLPPHRPPMQQQLRTISYLSIPVSRGLSRSPAKLGLNLAGSCSPHAHPVLLPNYSTNHLAGSCSQSWPRCLTRVSGAACLLYVFACSSCSPACQCCRKLFSFKLAKVRDPESQARCILLMVSHMLILFCC